MRIMPRHWSDKALRAGLPQYSWKVVLSDIQRDIGQLVDQTIVEEPPVVTPIPSFAVSADWGF